MDNWVKVYKASAAISAEMVKDMLLENNIEAVVVNKIDSTFHFGEAGVWVMPEQEEATLVLIQHNFKDNNE